MRKFAAMLSLLARLSQLGRYLGSGCPWLLGIGRKVFTTPGGGQLRGSRVCWLVMRGGLCSGSSRRSWARSSFWVLSGVL